MNSLCNFVLLLVILLANYSSGRSISRWSTNTDPSIIEECLRKSLKHINFGRKTKMGVSDVTNVVCETQFKNGLNIKLTFDLQDQRWECVLYKSLVQTLSIQYETCTHIEKEPLPEQQPNDKDSNDDDDEAKIDAIHQDREKEAMFNEESHVDKMNERGNNEDRNHREGNLGVGEQQNLEQNNDQGHLGIDNARQNANQNQVDRGHSEDTNLRKGNLDVGEQDDEDNLGIDNAGQNANQNQIDQDTLDKETKNKQLDPNFDNQEHMNSDEDNQNMNNEQAHDNNVQPQHEDTNNQQAPNHNANSDQEVEEQ